MCQYILHHCQGYIHEKAYSIYKHYFKEHNTAVLNNFLAHLNVNKKCMNKFDCLVYELLFSQQLKPALNVQFQILLVPMCSCN